MRSSESERKWVRVKRASELFIASHYLCNVYVFLLNFMHSTIFLKYTYAHSHHFSMSGTSRMKDTRTRHDSRKIYGKQMNTHTPATAEATQMDGFSFEHDTRLSFHTHLLILS